MRIILNDGTIRFSMDSQMCHNCDEGSSVEFTTGCKPHFFTVRQQSKKNKEIQEQIRQKLLKGGWATGAPLPPAREMAASYDISSSTAYRILVRLAEVGVLWQHRNGRFYAAAARHLVDTVQPFACMLLVCILLRLLLVLNHPAIRRHRLLLLLLLKCLMVGLQSLTFSVCVFVTILSSRHDFRFHSCPRSL